MQTSKSCELQTIQDMPLRELVGKPQDELQQLMAEVGQQLQQAQLIHRWLECVMLYQHRQLCSTKERS